MVFKWTQEMSAKNAFCHSFLDTVYGVNKKRIVAKVDTICFNMSLNTIHYVYGILYTIHYTMSTIYYIYGIHI